jgi:hypothetical protein
MLLYWGFERNLVSSDLVYWGMWEICKRTFWKWASVSIWAPLRNLEVGEAHLLGTSRDSNIWVPFFWTQRMLRASVWGQSGTLVKKQGSHDLASEYEPKRACHKGLGASGPKGLKPNYYPYVHLDSIPSQAWCHVIRSQCCVIWWMHSTSHCKVPKCLCLDKRKPPFLSRRNTLIMQDWVTS